MSEKLHKYAYKKLIKENLEWLLKQPHTLERDHIAMIVEDSVKRYYSDKPISETIVSTKYSTCNREKFTTQPYFGFISDYPDEGSVVVNAATETEASLLVSVMLNTPLEDIYVKVVTAKDVENLQVK